MSLTDIAGVRTIVLQPIEIGYETRPRTHPGKNSRLLYTQLYPMDTDESNSATGRETCQTAC